VTGEIRDTPAASASGTVARAVQLLRALAEAERDVTVAGLAERLDLPRPTVHRLLGLLREEGMVETRPGHSYGPGPEFVRVAALVSKHYDLGRLARPFMQRVAQETAEACMLCVYLPAKRRMIIADDVASTHPLGYRLTRNEPMSVLWGASGRAILAFLPEPEIAAVVASDGPSPVTGAPVPDPAELQAILEEIRAAGYAYTQGQKIPDSRGIAAPIRGAAGTAVGSLALTIPELRYRPEAREELGATVRAHATELSRLLGFEGTP
jgi:DNA-binding IclR family transcriptional regulator